MATMSALKEVKEALDAGLVSQAEFDKVKRDYLRGKEECQKLEIQAKKEALEANKEFQKREADADLRAYALESIVKHGSSIMSEEQKVDLVRDYVRMSGLDCDVENDEPPSKRQRSSTEERDASLPESSTPPPAAPASEDSSYSDDDGEDDSQAAERRHKQWTEEDDAALVAALRDGQKAWSIRIRGRSENTAYARLQFARAYGTGSPALRKYLEETCPEYVYKGPQERLPWSEEEEKTFIRAHKEGKKFKEITAMLPGRTCGAVRARWSGAKNGKWGSAALRAYAAEYRKNG